MISVDPAHSLSDSFDKKIGGDIKKITKNLFAVEIDPEKAMQEYKERFAPQMEKFKGIAGLEGIFDIAGMTPGIDEIAAFDKFLQYMHQTEYDIIIFDTAPTGHALRFLSLPEVLDSWVGKMIKIRMQFSGVIGVMKKLLPFGEEGDESMGKDQLEAMKKRIEDAREILSDPEKTHYNIVLIPEAMSIMESERSLKTLDRYNIPVDTIIVNQVLPTNANCAFCQERRKIQAKRLDSIKKVFKRYHLVHVNLFDKEVRGMKMLQELSERLTS